MNALHVVVIEDEPTMVSWYESVFAAIPYPTCHVTYVSGVREFRERHQDAYFNLALVDYFLADGTALDIVRDLKFRVPHCFVAMVSSLDDTDAILGLIGAGIDGFLRKPVPAEKLHGLITTVYDRFAGSYSQIFRTIDDPGSTTRERADDSIHAPEIVYESEVMSALIQKARRVAPADSTILIRGASGTGKELIARFIHRESDRRDGPLVTINIAALPDTLLESELFGHKRGAFTGATADRTGRVTEADGGTLFIDEVGDVPHHVQAKLLRLIQFRQYERLGDNRTNHADVRIVAATSRDLERMIADRSYREDLFYRLSVITLTIPPLRERSGDLTALVNHFLERKAAEHRKPALTIRRDAFETLLSHDYPGNVRELENTLEHAVVMARGGEVCLDDLPDYLVRLGRRAGGRSGAPRPGPGVYEAHMHTFEVDLLSEALLAHGGNQRATARALGISERKLRYRLQVLGIERGSGTTPSE